MYAPLESQSNFGILRYYNQILLCFVSGDGQGDACEDDFDQDKISDLRDVCPEHSGITATNFTQYQVIKLDPKGTSQVDPQWEVLNKVL